MRAPRFFSALLTLALALSACGGDESPDGKLDPAAPGGKADAYYGECEIRQVLAWVNDPEVSAGDLKEFGVHSRAANNIIDYRDGPDGIPGTADDDYFDDAQELDDVYYVGKVAFEQMVAAVEHRCGHTPTAEVIFSPQSYSNSHLARVIELINAARSSIDIAMYSFSDYGILDALQQAVNRGVSVRFVFESASADRTDPAGTMSAKLEDIGIDVRYVNKIMHHKFAIFDGPRESVDDAITGILATGSGNWSHSAGTRYDENTIILTGCDELLLRFQKEFNLLWENSRDFTYTRTFDWFFSKTITEWMIPDIPVVDAVFTSANFRTSVTSYGPTFSVVRGENEVSDVLVGLIQDARSSIRIASGHLRSRPVAEALMAKHAANPNLDIRVYLDGQEYISEWYQAEQDADLEDCLEAQAAGLHRQGLLLLLRRPPGGHPAAVQVLRLPLGLLLRQANAPQVLHHRRRDRGLGQLQPVRQRRAQHHREHGVLPPDHFPPDGRRLHRQLRDPVGHRRVRRPLRRPGGPDPQLHRPDPHRLRPHGPQLGPGHLLERNNPRQLPRY